MKSYILLCLFYMTASLAAVGQTCYDNIDDASGIDRTRYFTDLNTKACALNAAMEDFAYDFGVYDFGFYAEVDGYDDFLNYDVIFERAKGQIGHTYYLFFAKESNFEGIYRTFHVEVHLPDSGPFADLTPSLRESISGLVEEAARTTHDANNRIPQLYSGAEMAAMDKLIQIIAQIKAGTFGFNAETLLLNGFIELPFDGGEFQRTGIQDLDDNAGIHDYAGIEHSTGGAFTSTATNARAAIIAIQDTFSSAILFTDNTNFTDTTNYFETANAKYKGLTDPDAVLWFHFYEEVDSSSGPVLIRGLEDVHKSGANSTTVYRLFLKFKSNLSESELLEKLDEQYASMAPDTSAFRAGPTTNSRSNPCYEISLKWRAEPCLDQFLIDIGGMPPRDIGIALGFIEGAVTLADFFVNEISWKTIFELLSNPYFRAQIAKTVWNSAKKIVRTAMGLSAEEWEAIVYFADYLLEQGLETLILIIWDQLKATYDNIAGSNGTLYTGYLIGRLLWDILFEIITAGAGALLSGSNAATKFSSITKDSFIGLTQIKSIRELIQLVFARLRGTPGKPIPQKARVDALIVQCFAGPTPVHTRNGQLPIAAFSNIISASSNVSLRKLLTP